MVAGGMGEVYRAKDPRPGREGALNVLPASFAISWVSDLEVDWPELEIKVEIPRRRGRDERPKRRMRMRASLRILFTFLGLSVFSVSVLAFSKPWTLGGVVFNDGGTASGSVSYDAATNTYSNINVTTTAGTTLLTGASYTFFSNGFAPGAGGVLLNASNAADLTGTRGFAVFFNPPLSEFGTTTTITGQEATCADAGCNAPAPPSRFVSAGAATAPVQANPVPTLSIPMLALLALALAGAGLLLIRRL
jgi:hypothetical protein